MTDLDPRNSLKFSIRTRIIVNRTVKLEFVL